MKGRGRFRIEADGGVEIGHRILQIALRAQQVRAAEIGGRVAWIGGDGHVEIGQCLIAPTGLAIGQRAVGVGGDIVGIELDGGREIADRLDEPPDAGVGRTTGVVRLRAGGIGGHDLVQRGNVGLGRLAALLDLCDASGADGAGPADAVAAGRQNGECGNG